MIVFDFAYPIVAKVGGLQSQGAKDEAVVNLLRTLGNAGSGVLRLSRRVNNMASNKPHPLNSPWVGNQKWRYFDDFCLKLEYMISLLPCCLCNVRVYAPLGHYSTYQVWCALRKNQNQVARLLKKICALFYIYPG